MRKLKLLGVALIGSLALTGCMKVDSEMKIHEDGTASGTMIMAYDTTHPMFEGQMEDADMDEMEDMFDSDDFDGKGTVEEYKEGKWVGQKATFKGATVADMFKVENEEANSSLVRDGDTFTFTMKGDESMITGAEGTEEAQWMQTILSGMEINIAYEFPGKVESATEGVTVKGNRAVITKDALYSGKDIVIVAGAKGSAFDNIAAVGSVVLLLVLVGAGAALVLFKRGGDKGNSSNGNATDSDVTPSPTAVDPSAPSVGDIGGDVNVDRPLDDGPDTV